MINESCKNCKNGSEGFCGVICNENFGHETEIHDDGYCENWEEKE